MSGVLLLVLLSRLLYQLQAGKATSADELCKDMTSKTSLTCDALRKGGLKKTVVATLMSFTQAKIVRHLRGKDTRLIEEKPCAR